MLKKIFNILAIETSCDETAAAVLQVHLHKKPFNAFKQPLTKTLSSVVRSQIRLHKTMGGVVPEAAARAHATAIQPIVTEALKTAKINLNKVDYLAVTQGPGLKPSLATGVEFAKTLSWLTKKPLLPINHMLGHLYSPFITAKISTTDSKNLFPSIALIVSGGHTMLVLIKNFFHHKLLGQTIDDAAGEAFDKVAKMLSLPYPGGPEISKLAVMGKPNFTFPRPMLNSKDYNFSFSGLKTAVLYYLQSLPTKNYSLSTKKNVCTAFQDAVVDVLVTKTLRAANEFKAKSITLSGGVSANKALREELNLKSQALSLKFLPSPFSLSGDNAEMIGLAAAFMLTKGYKPTNPTIIKADSNLEL